MTSSKPGVGAMLQLQMLGPQDQHMYELRDAASSSQFKQRVIQSSRFATTQKTVDVSLTLGSTVKAVIPRRGDLLGNIALSITLPAIPGAGINDYWRPKIGYVLLKKMRIVLNDVELDSSERLWLALHDDVHLHQSMKAGVADMIGANNLRLSQTHTVVVPLKLFCCYRPGQRQTFLPLLSSTGQNSLILEIETETFENAVTSYSGVSPPVEVSSELIMDFVFLDEAEKATIINSQTPLLCEVVQDCEGKSYRDTTDSTGGDSIIATDTVQVDLSELNMPVRYIVFVAYSQDAVTQRRFLEYEDIIDRVSLRMDGWDRTQHHDRDMFGRVQTFYHSRNCISENIYLYSFALDSTNTEPNGHFTFSHVRRPILYITLKEKRSDIVVKVFALGYRWVDFQNGDAQIRFL